MLCTHKEIAEFVDKGYVKFSDPKNINATSLDVMLGSRILKEPAPTLYGHVSKEYDTVDLATRTGLKLEEFDMDVGYLMSPGEFILGHTVEEFHMPDWLSAEFKLKSSLARLGLEHLTACWIDPGFHDSVLTLELKNMLEYHRILIRPGIPIGQIVFYTHDQVHHDYSYRQKGKYNGLASVSGARK